ncbi:hypothetical protein SLS62_003430 [Diatrype stigma]|uniref:Uncharacterized protein n=1 Tax=Diatrype stigma TaxID=117547 RepID=A0AAN9UVB9_9PEZI
MGAGVRHLARIYMSGSNAQRDQSKKPLILGDYCLMRGDAENRILEYARKSGGAVQACVAKPGIIEDPSKIGALEKVGRIVLRSIVGLFKVNVDIIAAALLNQAVNGFEKDTLQNEDLSRIGTVVCSTNISD